MPVLAVHRTILAVDVEGFGNRHRTNPHQVAVREGLYRVLRQAFHAAIIPWSECHHEDRGDGILILAPPEVAKSVFVESLPAQLVEGLREHNSTRPAPEQIRLRMALHAGELHYDEHGVTGASINLTFRLLDASPFKSALAESPGVLVLITSSWFFEEVVRHSSAADPTAYRPIRVRVKETNTVGWIHLPDHPYMTGEPIRVLIADDHPPVRAGVRALLDLAPDIEVVAEVGTSDDAIRAVAEYQPDVVMMDLRMPGVGGIEATRTIVQDNPQIAVLVLTMVEDSDSIFAALRAGARGYLLKESGSDELARAVHAVASGEFITSPGIARRVSTFFATADPDRPPQAFPTLTERERELLDLIAEGKNNAHIAQHLFISPKTVRNHISNIFAKLQVADRAEAIVRAREAGLGGERRS